MSVLGTHGQSVVYASAGAELRLGDAHVEAITAGSLQAGDTEAAGGRRGGCSWTSLARGAAAMPLPAVAASVDALAFGGRRGSISA